MPMKNLGKLYVEVDNKSIFCKHVGHNLLNSVIYTMHWKEKNVPIWNILSIFSESEEFIVDIKVQKLFEKIPFPFANNKYL